MKNHHKIIKFPSAQTKGRQKQKAVRNLDTVKYFTQPQIRLLRKTARDGAATGRLTNVREWMAVDLLTSTGLRVSEAADVRCGDLKIDYGQCKVFVRDGKGSVSGHVVIPDSLKKHLKGFLRWKEERGEPTGQDEHLFMGQRGPWGSQAIQQVVKKYLKVLNLYESGKSCHSLRHSYGVELYRKERDLRAVQKQLRHVSIQSTTIYADVTDEDIAGQLKGLWG